MKFKKIYILLFFIFIVFIFIFCVFNYKQETVAVIGAMDVEINEVLKNISNSRVHQKNNFQINIGSIGKYKIILSKSGIGKVNSSITAQYIIDKFNPKYIINIGIAGSLSDKLKAGDIIIAKNMIQHDFDVTAFNYPKGYMETGFEPDKPTVFNSDKKLIDIFQNKLSNNTLLIGTIATGDIFIEDKKLKNDIEKEFRADAIDMESAAIAQTAQKNNIPLIVIRTISDSKNDTTKEYRENKLNSAQKTAEQIVKILKDESI